MNIENTTDKTEKANTGEFYIAAKLDQLSYTNSLKYDKQAPTALTNLDNITSILRDTQNWSNFKQLLTYCDYYINYDSMAAGAIKNILVPFSQPGYRLVGGNEKGRKAFSKWLNEINFEDILSGMANDYHKYGQTYLYMHDNGSLQILPVHRCMIESMAVNGEPVISYEIPRVMNMSKTDITSIERKYAGYPKEIAQAAKNGESYAQLRLGHTFVVSGTKAYWEKYSLPILTSALPWLLEKEVLNETLLNELDNMKRSFLEVQVGDKDILQKPSRAEITSVVNAYKDAISTSGTNLAVVAWNVKSNWIQANSKEVLKNISDSISFVNWNILSAMSMSPILAAGDAPPNKATASSFSTTQAAIGIVNKRINAFLNNVQKVMNKIMFEVAKTMPKGVSVPKIIFDIVDLGKEDKLMDELMSLYREGLISVKTVLDYSDFDYNQELDNKRQELRDGINELFGDPSSFSKESNNGIGRPTLDIEDRTSDLNESLKNSIPTPSDM